MDERKNLRRATELWQEAYRYQMEGELDRAIDRYQRSIDVCPTAEAHTFLGWTLLPSALQSERRLPGRHAPPGNVHSADGWEKILLPIIERSQVRGRPPSSEPTRPLPSPPCTRPWSGGAWHTPSGSRPIMC